MNESKKRVCKYPKCKKEIPGEKGIFCSHHKKYVKEKNEAIGASAVGALSLLALFVQMEKQEN